MSNGIGRIKAGLAIGVWQKLDVCGMSPRPRLGPVRYEQWRGDTRQTGATATLSGPCCPLLAVRTPKSSPLYLTRPLGKPPKPNLHFLQC